MPAEQELDERVATTLKRLDVTTRESWPWVTTGELEDLIRDLRAELQAAQEREKALLDALDDAYIALEIRQRDAEDDGKRLTLDELCAELGIDREALAAQRTKGPYYGSLTKMRLPAQRTEEPSE